MLITPEVEEKSLKMESNTGKMVFTLPQQQYKKIFPKKKFKKTTTYTGEKIKPRGKLEVVVKHIMGMWKNWIFILSIQVAHFSWEGTRQYSIRLAEH